MGATLQSELLRMNREILAIKSSQTKPASLRIFSAWLENVAQDSIHTIYFEGDAEFAPIIANDGSVALLPFDAGTNSQRFISMYLGDATIHIVSSRPISRIE